jgi:transcriptional regulator of arginine metabolism
MKAFRQTAILEEIGRQPVTSQEQLRERLRSRGIEATQATISRDIRDLGLIKQPTDGSYRRAPVAAPGDANEALAQAVADYLRRLDVVAQMLVLKTDTGLAQPLAVAIDATPVPEIVGTIAGDDTILIICRTPEHANTVAARFRDWQSQAS